MDKYPLESWVHGTGIPAESPAFFSRNFGKAKDGTGSDIKGRYEGKIRKVHQLFLL